ncbi:MAG: hypothetical protein N2049_07225, partial [Anaerolineales bacterium]|nr:hypothetical protein [Anaerolineales bacterium]
MCIRDRGTAPGPLQERAFYHYYRDRLEHKLRHKDTQMHRLERLIPTLPPEQRNAFQAMLEQVKIDRDEIAAQLQETYRILEELSRI